MNTLESYLFETGDNGGWTGMTGDLGRFSMAAVSGSVSVSSESDLPMVPERSVEY